MTTHKVLELTPDLISTFKEKKILQDNENYLSIELPELEPGDEIIGVLTSEESSIFLEMVNLDEDIEIWSREIYSRMLREVADNISKTNIDVIQAHMLDNSVLTEEESFDFYQNKSKLDYLHGIFWFSVKTRLSAFNRELAIKNGFRVVSQQKLYSDAS